MPLLFNELLKNLITAGMLNMKKMMSDEIDFDLFGMIAYRHPACRVGLCTDGGRKDGQLESQER